MFMVLENGCKTIVATNVEAFDIGGFIDFMETLWGNDNEVDCWSSFEHIAGTFDMNISMEPASNPHIYTYDDYKGFIIGDAIKSYITYIVDFMNSVFEAHDELFYWGLLRAIAACDTRYDDNIHVKIIQKGVDKNKNI